MIAGRYVLEREIGRGGAGVVHLGHDEVLGRDVAIKRMGLLPGTTEDDVVRAAPGAFRVCQEHTSLAALTTTATRAAEDTRPCPGRLATTGGTTTIGQVSHGTSAVVASRLTLCCCR